MLCVASTHLRSQVGVDELRVFKASPRARRDGVERGQGFLVVLAFGVVEHEVHVRLRDGGASLRPSVESCLSPREVARVSGDNHC